MKLCKTKKPALLVPLILMLSIMHLTAQVTVNGTVTDIEEIPLIGVNIFVDGTSTGTITDADGTYELTVPNSRAVLVFSYTGYSQQKFAVGSQSIIDVVMSADNELLEEVVVIGYGKQTKKELTGAIVQVKSEEIEKLATSDFASAIQGQMAGVSVRNGSGAPGTNSQITIRGVTSFQDGGSEPLYVVDGVTYTSNPNITPQEIESIEVLKDGASAAIYGSRASGGVVLITTKQGKEGQMKVSLDSYYGIKNITSSVPLAGTTDALYIESIQDRAEGGQNANALSNNPDALYFDTDWSEELQVDNAPIQNHSLGISGGRNGLTFNVTGTYFNETGSLVNSEYEKYSLRSNTSFKKGKFNVQTNLGVNIGNQEREPFALLFDAFRLPPYRVPLNTDESEFILGGTNPERVTGFAAKLQQESTRENRNLNGNVRIGYEILKGLKFQANLGGSVNNNNDRFFAPSTEVFTPEGEFNPVASNLNANLRLTDQTFTSTIAEFTLNYNKTFGDHRINLLAGNTYETREFEFIRTGANFITSNSTPTLSNGEPIIGEQSITGTNTASLLGRVLYSYKQKYMLSAVVRRDGSSNFGINNRYGTFPSLSAAWTISEEGFWSGLRDVVSFFKIRAGYGTTGSDRIPAFAFNPVVISSVDYIFGIGGTDITPGFTQPGFADPNLKWETNISRNIGVDLEFWNGKAGLTMEFYDNDKEDMLLNIIPPVSAGSTPIAGFNRLLTNIGNLENRGLEIEARYSHRINGLNLRYSGTFTRNINKVVSLSREGEIIYDGKPNIVRASQTEPVAALKEGLPVGAFVVYETNGTIKNAEDLAAYQALDAEAKLGDLRYVDANGDGAITIDDRVFKGSYQPDFEYGFNIDANYKGFDLTVQFFGVQGNTIYNGPKQYTYSSKRHQDLVYAWSPANPTSDVPTPRTEIEHPNVQTSTDLFLEDGSFLRLRNVIFGYSLPRTVLNKVNIGKLRIYVSAQNPITWTDYTGFDPEVSSSNPFNAGLDQGKYPISAVYRTGISLQF